MVKESLERDSIVVVCYCLPLSTVSLVLQRVIITVLGEVGGCCEMFFAKVVSWAVFSPVNLCPVHQSSYDSSYSGNNTKKKKDRRRRQTLV